MFTNIIGAAASDPAVINVLSTASVLADPTDVVSVVTGSVQFFTAATGNPLPDAQSQVSADGGSTWSVIDGTSTQSTGGGNPQTIATLTVGPVSEAQNGYEYRTMFTNTVEGVTSSVFTTPATLTIVNACIEADPSSTHFSQCHGVDLTGPSLATIVLNFGDYSNANLTGQTVRALNAANLNGANLRNVVAVHAGLQFSSLQGADLTDADLNQATTQRWCRSHRGESDGSDVSPGAGALTGGTFTRTSLIPGNNVTVTTAGGGATSAPATWGTPTNLPGARFVGCNHNPGDTFPLGATTVTCTVLDDSGHTAWGTFSVTVVQPTAKPIISTPTNPNLGQPSDVTVEGIRRRRDFHVTFTAVAVGNPDPTVQWQVLTSTGWTDVADATSFSFVIDNPPVTDGTHYRAVFTNAGGSVTSNPATLTVFPLAIPAQISGGQIFGDSPTFSYSFIAPIDVIVTGSVTCSSVIVQLHTPSSITPTLPVGTYSLAELHGLSRPVTPTM